MTQYDKYKELTVKFNMIDQNQEQVSYNVAIQIKSDEVTQEKIIIPTNSNSKQLKITLLDGTKQVGIGITDIEKLGQNTKQQINIFEGDKQKGFMQILIVNNKGIKGSDKLKQYLEKTGLELSFQVIFAEIMQKKVPKADIYVYTAQRLREIGNDLQNI
ncbi:hypothetical protein pb186bvf_008888 [Paramecium bursaria]